MATNGFHGVSDAGLQWKVGLLNCQGKYLTAESFGFKINASSNTMRKKQLWTIDHQDDIPEILIQSHLGRFLVTDKKGNLTGDGEDRSDPFAQFTIEYHPDGSGRWSFKNKGNGYFLGGTDDNLQCYEKSASRESEWWTVHLDIHPHVTMRNVNRKKFGGYNAENDRIQFDALIPWGVHSLLCLHFNDGRYGVRTFHNRFVSNTGELVDTCSKDTMYTLEVRSGNLNGMALKDCNGKYLTGVGRDATLQSRNKAVSKDELFIFEESHPQVYITAHNGKMVSTKQGVDLTANQSELSDRETFQVEYDSESKGWRFRTCDNKYWSLEHSSGIQAVGSSRSGTGIFYFEYRDDGSMAIKASNGRYITARMNGSLYADKDAVSDKEVFVITIVNRPLIVLKTDFGFVGPKTGTNPRMECNKVNYVTLPFENGDGAAYYFKGVNGKYWNVDGEGMINSDSDTPKPFICNFSSQSRFRIRAPNGKWIKGEQNGIFCAKLDDEERATQFEY